MWYGCWIASSWSIARTPVARTISQVPYNQFVEAGIGRRFIKAAIEEAVRLGLLIVERGLYRGGAKRQPSRYCLAYLKWKFVPAAGAPYYLEPTHDCAISNRKGRRENRVEWASPVNHPGAPRVNSVSAHVSGWQSPISQIWRRDVGSDQDHHGCTTLYVSVYLPLRCMERCSTADQ
jgi:hypothetical protein